MRDYNPHNTIRARGRWDERWPTLFIETEASPHVEFIYGRVWISDETDRSRWEKIPTQIVRRWNIATDLLAQVERDYREWKEEQENNG